MAGARFSAHPRAGTAPPPGDAYPAALSPHVWLKQTTIAALADDAPIATWDEATQASSGSRPTKRTVGGKAVAEFDGINDFLTLPDLSALTAGEVFLLIKLANDPPSDVTKTGLWAVGNSGENVHFPYTDGTIYDGFGASTRKTTVNPAASLTAWRVYSVISEPGHWESFLDGVSLFSASSDVGFASAPKFGEDASDVYHLDGQVAELVLVPPCTTEQRALMLAYFATLTPA